MSIISSLLTPDQTAGKFWEVIQDIIDSGLIYKGIIR